VAITVADQEIEKLERKGARCLVGCIIAKKQINKDALGSLMTNLWKVKGRVVFKELQENMGLFEFSEGDVKRRVLDGRPWLFDRSLIVLQDFDGTTQPGQLCFDQTFF
jgi:hypothetical protein